MEESFARVETKYMLSSDQVKAIEVGLLNRGFSRTDFGSPAVQSLYYDTPDHQLIRDSLERPRYKEKLRLRAYGAPGTQSTSFIEIKKKYDGVVYKRRVALPLQAAREGLDAECLPEDAGQVGREALWMLKRYGLVPSIVIAYDRNAWFSVQEPAIRITFDRNLAFRNDDLDLTSKAENTIFTHPDQQLMEVKTCGTYPLWLTRLLWDAQAKRIHFSKCGYAYQHYIKHRQTADSISARNDVGLPPEPAGGFHPPTPSPLRAYKSNSVKRKPYKLITNGNVNP